MSAQLIDGKKIAAQIHGETAQKVQQLKARGIQPCIVFMRIGDDPASRAYVGMKDKKAHELGIKTDTKIFPAGTTPDTLLAAIRAANADRDVHGILVQAPIPGIPQDLVFGAISPDKDVDGFHPVNFGKLLLGDQSGFRPCTPAGVQELLIRSGIPTKGANAVILGRGNIVGKPMAAILCQKDAAADATVTIVHSRSRNIPAIVRQADIIIAAMGFAEYVKADMVKPGAVVMDVGVNRVEDTASAKGYKLVGDVAFDEVKEIAGHITPNPGGVGPMTIALLMANTVSAAEKQTR
ncbi:MAG: bifunctional 5,10-methylene-tetrahydrofolate dehydrogenase/5,10-methylene-tetrahydrofolate cyclohydrolase [Verrucomicrobiales bacterium]|jgi:methylenetetrahydrofolate dehydrogenase (NADP+)/methenyltetrahydrofolate cyclohydrolase|nr:bifunctional 5,10-methylene-tetrahydrofolate dehydrogenase/5,10-methylene-tetrahydrofolate cyclohydrolase [Verrucomicrobiales bacterium]